jgi:hypothetical protein
MAKKKPIAAVDPVPATIEERMLVLAHQAR